MPYKDPKARRAAQARYREKNLDAIRARRTEQIHKIRKAARERYHKNPGYFRDAFLRSRYGISQADFDRMFFEQDGRCAVCDLADFPGPGNKPHVDHDHKTGKVRGLVCVRCNVLLGMAQDQPERFHAAIQYLKKHNLTNDPLID